MEKTERITKTELAISTDFMGEPPELEQLQSTLRQIKEAGFTHIHWCHEWEGDYIYSSFEMQQIREWMEEYGLQGKALHATKGTRRNVNLRREHYRRDYTSDWEYNRKAGVELIKNRVDMAACLSVHEIVLHLYAPHFTILERPQIKEDFYACVCRSFDELMPYCLEKDVRICLENLFDMPGEYMLEIWDRLFAKYPAEYLGLCFDTGHANIVWGQKTPDIMAKYQDRIYAVHLHDNDGSVDFHRLPKEGNIAWESVMNVLAHSPYEGPLLLEVNSYDPDPAAFLKKAYQAGCYLDALYGNAKSIAGN